MEEGKRRFREINEDVVRDFREYAIPTIEIRLDDETSLDEIISLFVDINQQGVSVNRFDIVKAMCQGVPILKNVFGLLALHQRRGQDVHYKMKDNEFTVVLKNLQIIDRIAAGNAKVDRMWEKLLELALFLRSSKHRKPVEILKGFISQDISKTTKRLTKTEERELRVVFRFLRKAIKTTKLRNTKLFVDQTHFYTMVTSIIRANLLKFYTGRQLERRLEKFGRILDGKRTVGNRSTKIQLQKYQDLSAKQTTDVSRRFDRDKLFVSIINTIDS